MFRLIGLLVAFGGAAIVAWWWIGRGARIRRRLRRQATAALQRFPADRSGLGEAFRVAASATGKPRGLRWTGCRLTGEPTLARDRVTGDVYALLSVEVSFEAIPGGDMEDVEAVSNVRAATAVFVWRGREWRTDGRVVFNHTPAETLQRYADSLERQA
ncbi:MAG: hypothetical protein AAF805_08070 [Planctomycetota bacterium]